MNGYQRMISYLYRYENHIKTANTGYARIEQRNGKCRITISLQDLLTSSPEVSLFVQKEDYILLIPAGKLRNKGNSYGTRIETSTEKVLGTDYDFSNIDGIILTVSDGIFYATTWKEIQIRTQNVLHIGDEINSPADSGLGHPAEISPSSAPQLPTPKNRNVSSEELSLNRPLAAEEANIQPSAQTGELKGQSVEATDIPREAASIQQEQDLEWNEWHSMGYTSKQQEYSPEEMDFGQKIISMFPKMYPFDIDNMEECVRLDLKDIGYLPVQHWSLAGNPFLLHGYFCYRHLIFTRLPHGEYVIGVPGIYNETNRLNAEECGFTDFQALTEVPDLQNAFGYWIYSME